MKYPHNDDYMTYDFASHRYYLTDKAIFEELGINFGELPDSLDANPSTLQQRFIKNVTNTVYRYLYKCIYDKRNQEYVLATVEELRPIVKEMLLAQAEYEAQNGKIHNYSGIDIYKGNHTPRYAIKEAIISPVVEELSDQFIPSIGRSLFYRGVEPLGAPSYVDCDGNAIY